MLHGWVRLKIDRRINFVVVGKGETDISMSGGIIMTFIGLE